MLQNISHIPNNQARRNELRHRLDRLDRPSRAQLLGMTLDDPFPMIRHDVAEGFQAELCRVDNGDGPRAEVITRFLEAIASGRSPSHHVTDAMGMPRDHLPHRSMRARITACVALEASVDPGRTMEVIRPLLRAECADLRYQALIAIYRLADDGPVLYDAVVDGLYDDDPEVAVVATQIAVKHGWADLVSEFLDTRGRLAGEDRIQVTFSIGALIDNSDLTAGDLPQVARTDMIAECVAALRYEPHTAAAIKTLARLQATEAVDDLVTVTKKWFAHPILKVEAAAALVDLGNPRGMEFLEKSLRSRRRDARGYALRLVGQKRLQRFFSHLVDVASDDVYHSDTATIALTEFGGPDAREVLSQIAQSHPNPEVRRLAQEGSTTGSLEHHPTSALPDALVVDPESFDASL